MSETKRALAVLVFLLSVSVLVTTPSTSATETFVFGGCSQLKYAPGSPYESNVNSLLTSAVNSAMSTSYNNFTISGSSSSSSQDTVYGLFQCRGDLNGNDCGRCVARAVSQLGTLCVDSFGGALQLEGCFVKYDNSKFLGVEDKTVVVKKCGPSIGYDSDALTRRDAVLAYLGTSDGSNRPYRVGGSGDVRGEAQCVGDLSASECQDCLSEAIGRLKTECGPAAWGDMFLAKCYARYSEGGSHSRSGNGENDSNNNDEEIEKTLAILIGLIAGVALLIVFLSCLRKICEKGKGGK
ncbi:plasmodesmata-located protein 6 [Ziziphus jujuba]|uniref:Plasmodesmata-located protein 6 n=1 Tax=Ziziphus jujuba TaxID=326968 RepID=A0A6P4AI49_ZIZJJ|nr:plasmodesmata-located protein 6 [Ziziphus jujuba]